MRTVATFPSEPVKLDSGRYEVRGYNYMPNGTRKPWTIDTRYYKSHWFNKLRPALRYAKSAAHASTWEGPYDKTEVIDHEN